MLSNSFHQRERGGSWRQPRLNVEKRPLSALLPSKTRRRFCPSPTLSLHPASLHHDQIRPILSTHRVTATRCTCRDQILGFEHGIVEKG